MCRIALLQRVADRSVAAKQARSHFSMYAPCRSQIRPGAAKHPRPVLAHSGSLAQLHGRQNLTIPEPLFSGFATDHHPRLADAADRRRLAPLLHAVELNPRYRDRLAELRDRVAQARGCLALIVLSHRRPIGAECCRSVLPLNRYFINKWHGMTQQIQRVVEEIQRVVEGGDRLSARPCRAWLSSLARRASREPSQVRTGTFTPHTQARPSLRIVVEIHRRRTGNHFDRAGQARRSPHLVALDFAIGWQALAGQSWCAEHNARAYRRRAGNDSED
jgi:hypothetical protein